MAEVFEVLRFIIDGYLGAQGSRKLQRHLLLQEARANLPVDRIHSCRMNAHEQLAGSRIRQRSQLNFDRFRSAILAKACCQHRSHRKSSWCLHDTPDAWCVTAVSATCRWIE